MVAWQVREDSEGHCCIVFHHHALAARREGAETLGEDFEYVECDRAPQFDHYADKGHVPPMALLEAGWWFECHHCGHQVMSDGRDEEEDTPLDKVVTVGQAVYCNQKCKNGHELEKSKREQAFNRFKKLVKEKRPDLNFTEFEGGWPRITMIAKFTFPGSKYGGSARDQNGNGEITWYISNGDQEAWDKYEESRKETA
ncbi:hypothetical protein HJ095_23190 [Vibrio parahaemolyticus]|nr:hypothetical protein [Vibrio parahaemolyticus]